MKYSFLILGLAIACGCATSSKQEPAIDCRSRIDEVVVQKEIQADLKERFANYKDAYISEIGLLLHSDGTRYYPVSVTTKENKVYSVIYNYSPGRETCQKMGYQFILLTKQ